jgi:predicted metal-dependent hydrolase
MQLPPSLIDYVLVHELAHLREANHTPIFRGVVGQLTPGYEAQKSSLAVVGKNVWLGASADPRSDR